MRRGVRHAVLQVGRGRSSGAGDAGLAELFPGSSARRGLEGVEVGQAKVRPRRRRRDRPAQRAAASAPAQPVAMNDSEAMDALGDVVKYLSKQGGRADANALIPPPPPPLPVAEAPEGASLEDMSALLLGTVFKAKAAAARPAAPPVAAPPVDDAASRRIVSSIDDHELSKRLPVLFRKGSAVLAPGVPSDKARAELVEQEAVIIARRAQLQPGPECLEVLVRGLIRHATLEVAMLVFNRMRLRGLPPYEKGSITPRRSLYMLLLREFAVRGDAANVMGVLKRLDKGGMDPCAEVLQVLILLYNKTHGFDHALSVLDMFWAKGVRPDAACFGELLHRCPTVADAVLILKAMLAKGVVPNEACWTGLMRVCSKHGLAESALRVLTDATKAGAADGYKLWHHLLHAQDGDPEAACKVYFEMKKRGVAVPAAGYRLLLKAMRKHAAAPGDAATLHAEAFFRNALAAFDPAPEGLYADMAMLYARTRDGRGMQHLAEALDRPGAPCRHNFARLRRLLASPPS
eukprot:TRINITY_DN28055_c0_g1_i1.p2 TRINITY_DN28055_c0_g1~~TRINITY_DN28055_c0_g1_i1.p2  ORF type:complete len:518 (+),score=181.72 TRINITY_DN28055_c0_g1_i1:84-1637(+)